MSPLRARLPRADCPEHGSQTVRAGRADRKARFTLLFEAQAIEVLENTRSIVEACHLLRIGWATADSIMGRAVKRGVEIRSLEDAELKTYKAWLIKEAFRFFWSMPGDRVHAEECFRDWALTHHLQQARADEEGGADAQVATALPAEMVPPPPDHQRGQRGTQLKIQSIKSAARGIHSLKINQTRFHFLA